MRRAAAALLCLLLLCACAAPEQADALPQELVGSWVSAGNGDLIETMTLAQDGTISVQCTFRGKIVHNRNSHAANSPTSSCTYSNPK